MEKVYLIFDKFNKTSNYDNTDTKKIIINDILKMKKISIEKYKKKFPDIQIKECELIKYIAYENGNEYYMLCKLNIQLLKKYIGDNSIYDKKYFDILIDILHNNYLYENNVEINEKTDICEKTIKYIMEEKIHNDALIKQPLWLQKKLYDYQKKNIKWMYEYEKKNNIFYYTLNDSLIININNNEIIIYDIVSHKFYLEYKHIEFKGGALIDEVGLGKTIQLITLSLLNKSNIIEYIKNDMLYTKATLILCPNQIAIQWKNEFQKMITKKNIPKITTFLTKKCFDKHKYKDIMESDFVIVPFSFLNNKCFTKLWNTKFITNNFDKLNIIKKNMNKEITGNLFETLEKVNTNLLLFYWHRIIIDEFHEIYNVHKYSHIDPILKLLDGEHKWCVSGTPFDKNSSCLYKIIDFVTNYDSSNINILENKSINNYIIQNCFRRNTKNTITYELKLPALTEKVIFLNFTSTEMAIYNAFLANENNDKSSVFLRQLCCYPKLSSAGNKIIKCKTMKEIETTIFKQYKIIMDKSEKKLNQIINKIKLLYLSIYLRIKRKELNKKEKNIDDDNNINDENNINNVTKLYNEYGQPKNTNLDKLNLLYNNHDITSLEKFINNTIKIYNNGKKNKFVISETLSKIITNNKQKYETQLKDYNGKKNTFTFFNNVMEKLKKPKTEETCGICLGTIGQDNTGITKCGHIFCYTCLVALLKQSKYCPCCKTILEINDFYKISYEQKKNIEKNSVSYKKNKLIDNIGTKLANLILYLKKSNNHTIIFSQWDELLHVVGNILNKYNIKNIFCTGNVYQKASIISKFTNGNDIKIIMLSSDSLASGVNLTKANQIILLDPIYGSVEHRKNVEFQAIGRCYRLGQTKNVQVLRFVIKNTIEEEIYLMNK